MSYQHVPKLETTGEDDPVALLSYRRIYLRFSKFVNAFFFKVVLSMES